MVHFPSTLTEEEELLQKLFARLRKKKKAVAALKAPKPAPKEEKTNALKRKVENASSATEQAKKLFKAGAIKVAERKDSQTFKRSKRQKVEDKSTVGFQPFSSGPTEEEPTSSPIASPPAAPGRDPPTPAPARDPVRVKSLYDSFTRGRSREEHKPRFERHQRGNTVYVFGRGLTKAIIDKTFTNIGKIVNTSFEEEKSCCFITFEKIEQADEAIAMTNGSMVQGVQLSVSVARRQPTFEPTPSIQADSSWSTIAASDSQKGNHQDKRDLVTYDKQEDDPFA